MALKLSHSSVNRYLSCGKEYEFHYIKGYRAKVQSSALLFGTAIDVSLENYVKTKDFKSTIELFDKTWETQVINKKQTDLKTLLNFTYSDRDLDRDLLSTEDLDFIAKFYDLGEIDVNDLIDEIIKRKSQVGYKYLKKNEKQVFNLANWLSLKQKGHLMLIEAKEILDANLVELLGTQVPINLENEDGDTAVGFADLTVRWKGYDKPIVLDFKTSSMDYEEDSVKTSQQLATYVYALRDKLENTNLAGYVVLNKNMQKTKTKVCSKCNHDGSGKTHKTCDNLIDGVRCHGKWNETINIRARSQVIIDEVSELIIDHCLENFNEVGKAIKAEVFPRNLNNCSRFNGKVQCAFLQICHNNCYDDVEKKNE
jgi:hypothetical protein